MTTSVEEIPCAGPITGHLNDCRHRGDKETDRTGGKEAVADFEPFVRAGITTFDTADIYGPSQRLIGNYLRQRPEKAEGIQVLSKSCWFGSSQVFLKPSDVEKDVMTSLGDLGLRQVDLVQFFWADYEARPSTAIASSATRGCVLRGAQAESGASRARRPRLGPCNRPLPSCRRKEVQGGMDHPLTSRMSPASGEQLRGRRPGPRGSPVSGQDPAPRAHQL